MKMLFKVIIFLIININIINADDIISLYSKFLPKVIINNDYYFETENEKLNKYAVLDPDIIYPYIKHLNLKLEKNIVNPDSNYKNIFSYMLNNANIRFNEWINHNIQEINSNMSIEHGNLKKNLIAIFESKLKRNIKNKLTKYSADLNNNLIEYYKYLYFSRDVSQNYLDNVDYSDKNEIETKNIISKFEDYYNRLDQIDLSERNNLIEEIFIYHYLFDGSFLNNYPNAKFSVRDFIFKAIYPDYINYSTIDFALHVSSPRIISDALNFKDPLGEVYKKDLILFSTAGISFTYKIPVSDFDRLAFSSIISDFGLTFFNVSQPSNDEISWEGARAVSGLSVIGEYHINAFKEVSYTNFFIHISTPIYYVNRTTQFNIGVGYAKENYSFKFTPYVKGSVSGIRSDEVPEYYNKNDIKEEKKESFIYPIIDFSYVLSPDLNLKFRYFMYTNILFGISYNIKI